MKATGYELSFKTGESLRFDLTVPDGWCGMCRRDVGDEQRLTMTLASGDHVTACRSCMSEHAPQALAVIEAP